MKVKTCKGIPLGAVLTTVTILFAAIPPPALCDADDDLLVRANFTKGSDISSSGSPAAGLHRIKPLAPGQENPHAVPFQQRKSPNPAAAASSSSLDGEEEKSSGYHPANNSPHPWEADHDHDAEKKVSSNNLESRSNSSTLEGGIIPSKHPLFADRHNENAPGSEHPIGAHPTNNDDEKLAQESSAHEHVIRYQQHQSSLEDDSEEDNIPGKTHLNQHHPKTSSEEVDPPKLVDSVVVSSDSFPVRVGPNFRVKGNNAFTSNNTRTGANGIRKPIPVIRHEESEPSAYFHSQDRN